MCKWAIRINKRKDTNRLCDAIDDSSDNADTVLTVSHISACWAYSCPRCCLKSGEMENITTNDKTDKYNTRMHSSRMRTVRSSGRGVCLSACWDTPLPRLDLGPLWPDLSTSPGYGPGDPPPHQTPQPPPLGMGLETPPRGQNDRHV